MFSRVAMMTRGAPALLPRAKIVEVARVQCAPRSAAALQFLRCASSSPPTEQRKDDRAASYSTTPAPSTCATNGIVNGTPKFNPAMFNILSSQQVDVYPLSGTVGAEVRGVDLAQPLSDADKDRILEAYFRYGAVFFRDQNITHAQHLALAAEFGEPEPHPIVAGIDGYPEIVRIIKDANSVTKFGETWHSDHSFMEEPCVGSVLVARELPPYGNDTLWASMYAVYNSLSDGLKAMLDDMTAVHSAAYAFRPDEGDRSDNYDGKKEMKYQLHPILQQDVEHPAVITHPVTGKKSPVREQHVHCAVQGYD